LAGEEATMTMILVAFVIVMAVISSLAIVMAAVGVKASVMGKGGERKE
jgi:hypothetical protein